MRCFLDRGPVPLRWAAVLAVAATCLIGCRSRHELAGDSALEVRDASIHRMSGMAAGYLTVVNSGAADRLLAVTAQGAACTLHASVTEGDVVRMKALPDGVDVPARGRLELAPGGLHLMLGDLQWADELRSVALTLRFERAGERIVDATLETPPHLAAPAQPMVEPTPAPEPE